MNRNPLWKVALVLLGIVISALYALPNLYPDEPAIQVSGASAATVVTDDLANRAVQALDAAGVAHKGWERLQNSVLVRIGNEDAQVRAKEIVQQALGEQVVVALNLVPTTPEWLLGIGAQPMKLGLDLRGGVHFVLEVDVEKAVALREEAWVDQFRQTLRDQLPEGQRYRSVRRLAEGGIDIRFDSAAALSAGEAALLASTTDFVARGSSVGDEHRLLMTLSEPARKEILDYAIDQNRTTIANRVNELGVAEPLVQRLGANRIVVELPGVQDTASAKRVLGRTASLEFRLVDEASGGRALPGMLAPPGTEIFPFKDNREPPVILDRNKIVTGDSVIGAKAGRDPETNVPEVNISLDTKGGRAMQRVTGEHVKDRMAVLFVETRSAVRTVTNADGSTSTVIDKKEEKYVINQATIQSVLGSQFRITGLDSPAEAAELALLLRSGALAAPMYFVEERTIGPSLGAENIAAGIDASLFGFLLVLVFMLAYYRLMGVFGAVALLVNLLMLLAIMAVVGATLTLPGIAGIVLTMGMAVDANVLINERIKEELRKGTSVQQAIVAGYDRAWSTILDSNLTTLVVAVILFALGSGSVKGFAVTLSIGIVTSMYTAVVVSRMVVNAWYGGRNVNTLSIMPLWSRA